MSGVNNVFIPPSKVDLNEIYRWCGKVSRTFNKLQSSIPSDSTAADVATLKTDFNELLAVLREYLQQGR